MYYKYYYNSRGLPVVGWNAGDKEENKYNMKRYVYVVDYSSFLMFF